MVSCEAKFHQLVSWGLVPAPLSINENVPFLPPLLLSVALSSDCELREAVSLPVAEVKFQLYLRGQVITVSRGSWVLIPCGSQEWKLASCFPNYLGEQLF